MFNVMLAKTYKGEDPTGYFVSEKLDGVRAVWSNNQFMSRNHKPINAPAWFTKDFPKGVTLDGELFTKRKDFSRGMGFVMKNLPIDSEWEQVTYMVFDLPLVKLPVEKRYLKLLDTIKGVKYILPVPQVKLSSYQEFSSIHTSLVKQGAEGTILRLPGSYYEFKRSKNLLKYKDFYDHEAIVEEEERGSGNFKNTMGKLVVRWWKPKPGMTTGIFRVGSGFTFYERDHSNELFKKGTLIKVKYFELSPRGNPRFPIYLGIRHKKDL